MNYLHVLCMIFMVLRCVLCMTLMVFIYVYYKLFACTNLVDIMLLFSQFFCSIYRFSIKIGRFSAQTIRKSPTGFLKTQLIYRPNRLIYRCSRFHCSSVVSGAFWLNFPNFHQILLIFSKTDGIGDVRFL
jgi:hypothetical protein